MHVNNLVEVGIERGGEQARGGTLAGTHFAGEQPHAVVLREELEPHFDLLSSFGCEQLLGIGVVREWRLLEAKERFPHHVLILTF